MNSMDAQVVPIEDARALAALDEARRQIAIAKQAGDVDTLKDWRDKAAAVQHYAKRRDDAREAANDAGEVKVRAERALGQIDAEAAPYGGLREQDNGADNLVPLADIRPNTRAAWRKLGQLEDEAFEECLTHAKDDENTGVSTSALLKLSKNGVAIHFSSETDEWATPQDLFDELHAEFGFDLDVCALPSSAKCERFFSPEDDGLAQSWRGQCWMNPPYGKVIGDWVEKAFNSAEDGATVVCLVPARVDTNWWWDYCIRGEIRFLKGRLKFGDSPNSAPFPSAVVVFRPPLADGNPPAPVVKWWGR